MAPCPGTPNCVSSDALDQPHRVRPLEIADDSPHAVWQELLKVVRARPRTTIVTCTDFYLHATESSRIFGFIDDLEFQLRPGEKAIAVRSASRVGFSDLGVNRRRVEAIRKALEAKGVIHGNSEAD